MIRSSIAAALGTLACLVLAALASGCANSQDRPTDWEERARSDRRYDRDAQTTDAQSTGSQSTDSGNEDPSTQTPIPATTVRPPITDNSDRPLGIEDVLEAVDARYPLLIAAREAQEIANAQAVSAFGNIDAKVSGELDWQPLGFFVNRVGGVKLEQPTTFYGASFFGGWKIGDGSFNPTFDGDRLTNENGEWNGGFSVPLLRNREIDAIRRDLQQTDIGRGRALADIDQKYLSIIQKARITYWKWVTAGEQLRIAQRVLGLAEDRQSGIESRVEVGDLAPIDQVDNERLVVERRAVLVAARRDLERAAIDLSLFLRDEEGRTIRVGPNRLPEGLPLPGRSPSMEAAARADAQNAEAQNSEAQNSGEAPADDESPIDSESLGRPFRDNDDAVAYDVRRALEQRPELEFLLRTKEQLDIEREFRDVQRLPVLDLSVVGSQDIDGRRPTVTKGEFELVASLDFEMPLQNRTARGKLREVDAKLRQIGEQLRFATDQVEAQVRDARSALQAAIERSREARRAAELTVQLAEAERRKFELGDSDILILNIREQSEAAAQVKAVKALADYWVADAIYRAAVGDLPERQRAGARDPDR